MANSTVLAIIICDNTAARCSADAKVAVHVVGLPLMSGNPLGRATSLGLSSSLMPSALLSQSGVFCLPFLVIPGISCKTQSPCPKHAKHSQAAAAACQVEQSKTVKVVSVISSGARSRRRTSRYSLASMSHVLQWVQVSCQGQHVDLVW